VAQHLPTGSEKTPPNAPRSSRFGSEPTSVGDDVDVWRDAISELHARNDDDGDVGSWSIVKKNSAKIFRTVFIFISRGCYVEGYVKS